MYCDQLLTVHLGEFAFQRGMFVALCPKTYCAYDADYEEKQSDAYKLGRKGIPHRYIIQETLFLHDCKITDNHI